MAGWEEISSRFAEAVRRYHRDHAPDTPAAAVDGVVRTNADLVPERGEAVLSLVRAFTRHESIAGLRVLEAGSGFGALGAYLAWRGEPELLLGVDVRPDYIEVSRGIARDLDVAGRLEYAEGDMRSLTALKPEPFDIVVANNALVYLATPEDLTQALGEFHNVLAPGGYLVFHTANKWVFREPFSRAPLVHLLSPRAADAVFARTGWNHHHGRVRYVSAYELRRELRDKRFDEVNLGRMWGRKVKPGGFRTSRFFVGTARKPPDDRSKAPEAEPGLVWPGGR